MFCFFASTITMAYLDFHKGVPCKSHARVLLQEPCQNWYARAVPAAWCKHHASYAMQFLCQYNIMQLSCQPPVFCVCQESVALPLIVSCLEIRVKRNLFYYQCLTFWRICDILQRYAYARVVPRTHMQKPCQKLFLDITPIAWYTVVGGKIVTVYHN